MRVPISFLALLLSAGAASTCRAQGDVFSTNADRGPCDQARQAEQETYSRNIAALVAKYQATLPSPGPPNLPRLRQYATERGNEETRHAKAMVALDGGVCSYLRQTGSSPCDQATFREDKLYEQHMTALAERKLDDDHQADQQKLNCGSDADCITAANQAALKRLQAWAADRSEEARRHEEALARIRSGICSSPAALNRQPASPPPDSGDSSSQDPCCYTPARGPHCAPVRFGWGDCPGSKQACQWCYGPEGVFAYQPRGSAYSLSSGCGQLGPNTVWATRSSSVEQAMVKAGGNCTPDGKGGFNCANVDSRQFQCSQPPPSNSSSASSQDNCYTPARGPQCAPVRFGWGDCPGSKQACQWCYGPNGVFAYQPRGSLYSLESGCNSLGRDTIWQTNSPQAEQAMVRAGGSCKANGSGGYYCTNVDPKRYQQIQK